MGLVNCIVCSIPFGRIILYDPIAQVSESHRPMSIDQVVRTEAEKGASQAKATATTTTPNDIGDRAIS